MSKHRWNEELYTPITPEVLALLEAMLKKYTYWRDVSYVTGTRLKVLRRIKYEGDRPQSKRKCVSFTLMDRLITTTGIGDVDDFPWFTPEDLIKLGIWEDAGKLGGRKSIGG